MKNNFLFFQCLFLSFIILLSCGCTKAPAPEFSYAEGAITIHYQANPGLNSVESKPRSLLLVIYQLGDPNEFNRYAGYKAGVVKLLDAQVFDQSVTAIKKIYVEPGSTRTITLDRAERTQHLGIVAGYYDLVPANCVSLTDMGWTTKRRGLFKIWKETDIDDVTLNIYLEENNLRVKKATNES